MTPVRQPKTLEQATALLERYALRDGELALVESSREGAIAAANMAADSFALPILDELRAIAAALEPWWAIAGAALTGGKRKTVVLGGCTVGSKAGRPKLTYASGDDDAAVAALQPLRWAKPLVRVKASLDRTAIGKALDGPHGGKLAELGFAREAAEQFVVERVKQPGSLAAVA